MKRSNKQTLKSTLMAGAAVATAAGFAAPAYAQDAPVEKVTVTGSRIPQKGLTSVSPVSTITATEARVQGTNSPETLLNNMPQVFANQGAEVSNGSSGTATVDLRGIGPVRTLVLINGRRLNPASSGQPTADLNNIPTALIERVEVLTGGASAVYGADAVAGVVNFIMRKNFEGMEVGAFYGITDHENDNGYMRDLIAQRASINPSEFKLPDQHVNDGRIITTWGVMGANMDNDKGNITIYAQYRHAEPVLQSERDFSACTIATGGAGGSGTQSCAGSSNSAFGRFSSFDIFGPAFIGTANGAMDTPFATEHRFNFAPYNYLQRPDERYIFGTSAHYDVAADAQIYAEFQFNDDRTVAQIAPSGLFRGSGLARGNYLINCDNPFMTPAGVAAPDRPFDKFCDDAGLSGGENATLDIGRRFVEGGPRQDDFRHQSLRSVIGFKGTLDDIGWDYDVYAQYGQTVQSRTYLNDVSLSRIAKSLQVVLDPRVGEPTFNTPQCKSFIDGSDIQCRPFDIFKTGTLNTELLNYLVTPGFQIGTTQEWILSGSLNGDLGVTIPWAETPISAAIGAEYRQEKLEHRVDLAFSTGDLAGQGGPTPSVDGSFDVAEVFGEVAVPLVEDKPFMKLLELNGGYRLSDYENVGITHTYKYGLTYMPVEDLRFRGTFQRAVRAPNIVELFTPSYFGLWGGQDPCAATTSSGIIYAPAFTDQQCLNLGLSQAQVDAFKASGGFSCPSAQCAAQYRGNSELKPEESDTKSFGIVFTPTFLKGFTASVDYFDIFVDKVIGIIPQSVILATCADDPSESVCSRIHRADVSGILFGAGFIDSPNENLGSLSTTGVDVEGTYRWDLDMIDLPSNTLTLNIVGSWVGSYEVVPLPGADAYDCVGLFGTTCGTPTPDWKHKFRATWGTPWDVNFTFAWRHISQVRLDRNTDDPNLGTGIFNAADQKIPAFDYYDVAFDLIVSDHITVTGGINNIGDKDPTVLDSNNIGISSPPFGNANTFPVIYDSLGREVFVSMTTRF